VMAGPLGNIVNLIRSTMEHVPPELLGDVMTGGIVLTGGGALLGGLTEMIARETGLAVRVAADPLNCVVKGTAMMLDNLPMLRRRGALAPRPRSFAPLVSAPELAAHLGDD